MAECDHQDFAAVVEVNRLEGSGRFSADVRIECAECGERFRFLGLPVGLDLNGAAVSVDGCEARLAIAPRSASDLPLGKPGEVDGFSIRAIDAGGDRRAGPELGRPATRKELRCEEVDGTTEGMNGGA